MAQWNNPSSAQPGGEQEQPRNRLDAAIGADMQARNVTLAGLAREVGVSPATLRNWRQGGGWDFHALKRIAILLGRAPEEYYVLAGLMDSVSDVKLLDSRERVALLERDIEELSELVAEARIGLPEKQFRDSPGAELIARLVSAVRDEPADNGKPLARRAQVIQLFRGVERPLLHSDLVVVPGQDDMSGVEDEARRLEIREKNKARLLAMKIDPGTTLQGTTFGAALDFAGAFIEDGTDFLEDLTEEFGLAPHDLLIIVPRLLAGKTPAAGERSSAAGPIVVTSLAWGGAADVAALQAEDSGLGYIGIGRHVRMHRTDSHGDTPYGGFTVDPTKAGAIAYEDLARKKSRLLALNPRTARKNYCIALDEPTAALAALQEHASLPETDKPGGALAMIVMSDIRLKWTAKRRHLGRSDATGELDTQAVDEDFQQLRRLQDDLRAAVEQLGDRPTRVFTLKDRVDYDNVREATVDPDFDSFVEVAAEIGAWIKQTTGNVGPSA
ncbi:hypothetical protein SAMN06893096_103159 [Geodermatophilus pulveris]|uniref:HTH cro/C1-type domain-containing protein n=1 Tax=Geodermatophilus pulveris TaxID=1564159 RepID=A0A239DGU1_9ACTN|nr:helix-turn-helix domain-containing protein [Geodermatophilus pulveris]SNS31008.1 hypothetical protein SAMN06893096_103159 [Geodermatophilus pulveris]